MKILAIETSCDETAVSVVEAKGGSGEPIFSVRGNGLFSQASMHAEYGGVFPNLAKREHTKNIVPMLTIALEESSLLLKRKTPSNDSETIKYLNELLAREQGLAEDLNSFFTNYEKPDIDVIAVTSGPGLEPALWVGINAAKALSHTWNIPLMPINHMEGHMFVSLLTGDEQKMTLPQVTFPAVALLISGGHTELVLMKDWLSYEVLGQTRDDAVGEAFDKVARMLKLPYPGGPEISKLAATVDDSGEFSLPRPMIHSDDFDFSFSGIKTAVLYATRDIADITDEQKAHVSYEFENAVTDVLLKKTLNAMEETGAQTLLVGGGVSANNRIRASFEDAVSKMSDRDLYIPDRKLSTDNAIMIAIAAYMRFEALGDESLLATDEARSTLSASGTLEL